MKTASFFVCKSFLEQCPVEMQERLLALLSKEEQEEIKKIGLLRKVRSRYFCQDILEKIDLSWLVPYLRTLSSFEMHFLISLFSKQEQSRLASMLKTSMPPLQIGKLGVEYGKKHLVEILTQGQEILPIAVLPESPFLFLLEIEQAHFSKMIQMLGIHDLSVELKQIIATPILKKIFSALSAEEQTHLNALMLRQEHLIFKPQFLQTWDGTSAHLHLLIEERGLCRLGQAMYQEHSSFLWYLSRRFEMQKGLQFLVQAQAKPTHPRIETLVLGQIKDIFEKFCKKEEVA